MSEYLECNGKNDVGCGCKEFKIFRKNNKIIAECLKCGDVDIILEASK